MTWLLIGGPKHGQIIGVKAGLSIFFFDEKMKKHYYSSARFKIQDKQYLIGVYEMEDPVPDAEIAELIQATNFSPFM